MLRALGYSSDTDFRWDAAWELSDKLGITDGRYSAANATAFLRADVALISESALSAKMQGSGQTLLEKLEADGAIRKSDTEGLVFQPIPDEFIRQFGTSSTYAMERIEYALWGDDIYFRLYYSGEIAKTVYLMPREITKTALGDFKQYVAPSSGRVFTCEIEKSVLAEYPVIGIRQNETVIIENQILTGYLMLTEDGSPAVFQSVDYRDQSEKTDSFPFVSLEYAEVLGGRLYRVGFINDGERDIMFHTLKENQQTDWNYEISRFTTIYAGYTEELYFVSNRALKEYNELLIRVRDAGKEYNMISRFRSE